MAQFGVKEVMDFTITNYHPSEKCRKPIISVDYAQITEIENAGERIPVEGGQGNQMLMNFDHSKTTALNVTLPLVDLKMLALISGDEVESQVRNIYKREVFPANAGATTSDITLSHKPLDGSLYVYEVKGYRDIDNQLKPVTGGSVSTDEYSISGKTVSLNSTQFKDCKEVVVYYLYETSKKVTSLKIDPTRFPKAISFYGDTFFRDQFDEIDKLFHIVGHKGRIRPEYTLTMSGTDVAVLELAIDLYSMKDKCTGDQVYLEYIESDENEYNYSDECPPEVYVGHEDDVDEPLEP